MTKIKLARTTLNACNSAVVIGAVAGVSLIVCAAIDMIRRDPVALFASLGVVGVFASIVVGIFKLALWAENNSEDPPTTDEIVEATLDAFSKKT